MKRFKTLSIEVTDEPPTEFRIFTAGVVDTVKGEFLFDSKAAKLVLTEYAAHGIDLMIDYDHASLGAESAIDPANAGKAAGWFNIEVRGGELWAVNVRWTPPAADALKRKEWRFMSPAFSTDKSGRVTSLLNVALTNIPATRRLDPLVAASKGMKNLDPSLIKQALEAIEKGDAKTALELLKSLVASAAGADPDEDGDDAGSEGDGAEGVAPPTETESVEDPKVVDASDTPPPPKAKGQPAPPDDSDDDDEDDDAAAKKANRKVLRSALCRLTGKNSFAEAVAEVEVYRYSHLTLEAERQKLAKDRVTLESAERRKLVVELVKLGAEFPSTVWADDKSTVLKQRWLKMPIVELRSHVSEQKAARGEKDLKKLGVKPAGGSVTEDVQLSAAELAICADLKCDPKDYAALKRQRDGKGNS